MVVGGNSAPLRPTFASTFCAAQARPQPHQPAEGSHFLIAHRMKAYVLPTPGTGPASLLRLAA